MYWRELDCKFLQGYLKPRLNKLPKKKSYGLFDQLGVDNGREFYLSLAIEEQMSDKRQNQAIRCYKQTESKRVNFEHCYYVHLIAKSWKKNHFKFCRLID